MLLPASPLSHELSRCEPPRHRQDERDHVRPARVVREDDLREHDADGEADECTEDAGQEGHTPSEPPIPPAHKAALPWHYPDRVPELPEVETVRAQLEPVLRGRRFERVEIHDPRLVRPYDPAAVAAELEGERVLAVERRGKSVVVRFESQA